MADFDRILILETSGRVGQVALSSGDTVLDADRLAESHRRASDLTLVVQRLLAKHGWKARDLTAAVVGLGPGSYTGLRVGLASAKALAYATGCRFFGIETFAAIAHHALELVPAISIISDALQGKLFRRDYRRIDRSFEATTPLQIVTATDWLQTLPKGMPVSGPAAGLLADKVDLLNELTREPRPVDMLAVARECPWAVTTDVWLAEPLYLRGSSAEEKAARRT